MEPVTKDFLMEVMESFSTSFDNKLDKKLVEQRLEFERYIGIVSESFQSKLDVVIEVERQNTEDIREIKRDLAEFKDNTKRNFNDLIDAPNMLGTKVYGDHEKRIWKLELAVR